ncbi:hypothetical protein C3B64_18705 [Clostridium botulinum]|uniref:D-glucuronyl C5-epimerase C-terminal domain-containing protein n=1 Tax=Clostridium botulinum TaxID=1491 RepID=A0AAU8Z0M8_CLOBO|nr:D-glucuronyl C5-epimerase family protein [Clostridium sporogenes]AVP66161.1 hypothetical protein C3B64_18705 [Clostridium botulinum]MCF4017098.1 cell wall-binding repeat-containing protein [Clostridium sporogenes]NFG01564.1 hypothetical protein [Clostridium sporogenes]
MKIIKKFLVYILILNLLFVSVIVTNNRVYAKYNNQDLVNDAISRFPKEARDFNLFLADYEPCGDYLNYGNNKEILFNFKELKFDNEGMPKVKYGEGYYYNPVTLAQYSLSVYGEYLKGENTKENFLKIADKLLTLQDSRGGFLYNFQWRYYLNNYDYKPGWVSAMAQGQALSVLARAYEITGNKKYLEAGNKALNFLITPISKGGVMANLGSLSSSLKNNIIFEEYISHVPTYTLNGFMFSLLGLYDWANVDDSNKKNTAEKYFNEGIKSLTQILKYYDIGGFTCYDLGYITKNREKPHIAVNYHGVHIYLLNALYSITNDRILYDYYKLWKAYVDTTEVDRISGVNRYETNANISKEFTKEGIDTIILASGENYADALSAVPLASKNQCPILLAESNSINSFTINEIKRLNPNKIIVIGGEGAISQKVCNDIKKTNQSIVFERIGGKDRYETSYLISSKLDSKEAFLVYGNNYADTLSIATISAIKGIPILLTQEKYIPNPIKNYIDENTQIDKYYIIGGNGVISENIESQIENTERIGGKDRYETNTKVLNRFIDELDLSKVYMAIGGPSNMDYADALSCAPLAAISKSPILLVPTTRQIPKSVTDFAYGNLQNNTNIIAIGGKAILPNYKINSIIPEK